jgi:predicted anti-sigma-YlaC factor YlaD
MSRASAPRPHHDGLALPATRAAAVILPLLTLSLAATGGCSIKRMAINRLADAMTASGEVFASDNDPELVRDAMPFALKTIESLLAEAPDHRGLHLAACRGFTQYAYAFVQADAERLDQTDYRASARLRSRALGLYIRARDYGLRGLELDYPGIARKLTLSPASAVASTGAGDVELLYWTGAAWGAVISLGKDRPELAADLPAVLTLLKRALELDEAFDRGAIHETLIVLESLPANMGGSLERARRHYDRAIELSGGSRASTYVTWAQNVSVARQDRKEFRRMLETALAVDPDVDASSRVQNLITQDRARLLLERIDDLFLEDDPVEEERGS